MPTLLLPNLFRNVLLYSLAVPLLFGQAATYPAPAAGASQAPGMAAAWDDLIGNVVPKAAADPALGPAPAAKGKGSNDDFLEHFFADSRTTYEHSHVDFTGNNTTSNVIDAANNGIFNPAGIPSQTAFQPGTNRISEFLDFGTRGWLSDRIDTHVAMRYRQDLTHVDIASPGENVIETFNGNRLYELLEASVTIHSKPTDGALAGTSLELGRLDVYRAELASFDGASFSISRPRWTFDLYGGRRFSYFSDPAQRAIGGANLTFAFDPKTSIEVQTLWYIKGSNKITFRKRFSDRWLFSEYLRAYGGAPVDLDASALYSSRSGRDSLRVGFFQKLTSNDYEYDYTVGERNTAVNAPLLRLYLGPINPYSQFNIEGHHQILRNLRGGAAIIVRHLGKDSNQTPFETSFRDFRFNGQYSPWNKIETDFEYHQRSSDRLSPYPDTALDGLTGTGETAVKDLTANIGRAFGEGRFHLSGGVYYRRISTQDAFYYEENLHQSGWLASGWVRLDRRTRVSVDYSLDNDFYLFQPDLKNSQVLRLGLNWKY